MVLRLAKRIRAIWVSRRLFEEVLIEFDDLDPALHLHAYSVADHQAGEPVAVDEDDPGGDRGRVRGGGAGEPTRRDEDALVRLIAGECPDERLDRLPAHRVLLRVPLGLHVDPGEAEGILVDDAVDAAVVRELRARG